MAGGPRGNALLQAMGAGIAASAPDAQAIARRDPGCCVAEYLDQPVAPYTVDEPLDDRQVLRLGDADWEVLRTPGHGPGQLSLWQPDERLLVVGDALSDYDVGWVNRALDGRAAAATAAGAVTDLGPGDSYVIAGGIEHAMDVLEGGHVIDMFTPPREDYRSTATARTMEVACSPLTLEA